MEEKNSHTQINEDIFRFVCEKNKNTFAHDQEINKMIVESNIDYEGKGTIEPLKAFLKSVGTLTYRDIMKLLDGEYKYIENSSENNVSFVLKKNQDDPSKGIRIISFENDLNVQKLNFTVIEEDGTSSSIEIYNEFVVELIIHIIDVRRDERLKVVESPTWLRNFRDQVINKMVDRRMGSYTPQSTYSAFSDFNSDFENLLDNHLEKYIDRYYSDIYITKNPTDDNFTMVIKDISIGVTLNTKHNDSLPCVKAFVVGQILSSSSRSLPLLFRIFFLKWMQFNSCTDRYTLESYSPFEEERRKITRILSN